MSLYLISETTIIRYYYVDYIYYITVYILALLLGSNEFKLDSVLAALRACNDTRIADFQRKVNT
jgi:hypothetical protein